MVSKIPKFNDSDPFIEPDNVRDTIPDGEPDFIENGQADIHKCTVKSLLGKSTDWYRTHDEVQIIDLHDITAKVRMELYDLLINEYLKQAFDHIRDKTPDYSRKMAPVYRIEALNYLKQLHDPKYSSLFPLKLLLDLQTVLLNGDWITRRGIKEMRTILQQMLIAPQK